MPDDDDVVAQLVRYADAVERTISDVAPVAARPAPRASRWLAVAAAAVVVALAAGAVVLGGDDDDAEVAVIPDEATIEPSEPMTAGWSTFPPAPLAARLGAVAVVADGELLVWGGSGDVGSLADGAALSIADGTWRLLPPAPIEGRSRAVGAWTGDEWLVVGGDRIDGAAYDPGSDAWRTMAPPPMSVGAGVTGSAWTGTELVLVGIDGAAAYDPAADAWRDIAVDDGPAERFAASRGIAAVWTGSEVLAVAVIDGRNVVVDSVDPATGIWGGGYPTPASGLDTGEDGVVWTGDELLVIGHYAGSARFDPATGTVGALAPSDSMTRFPAVLAGRAVTVGDRWLDLDTMVWQVADPMPPPDREFPVAAGDGDSAFWWGGTACGRAANCVRIVDPGIGLRWGPPAQAAPTTSTATTSVSGADAAIAPGAWLGARTEADGRSLVVAFVGPAPYEPGVPCTVDYAMTAEEGPEGSGAVQIRIVVVTHPPPTSIPDACGAAGFNRTLGAPLEEPLGGRRLLDGSGVEHPVFDGTRLADPGELPPGWYLQSEQGGYPDPAAATSWERDWGPDRAADTADGQCTGAPAGIGLVQGAAGLLESYVDTTSNIAGTFDVRGNPATARESPHRRDLAWVEGGEEYFLRSTTRCDRDTLASVDELVAFARALVVA